MICSDSELLLDVFAKKLLGIASAPGEQFVFFSDGMKSKILYSVIIKWTSIEMKTLKFDVSQLSGVTGS